MSSALARRFKLDVSLDASTWLPFKGMNDFNPAETATIVDANDYDTNGFSKSEKTMTGGKVTAKAFRPVTGGVFDPGQELVRATRYQFGDAARVYIRWYDRNGAPEAYQALALVDWNQSKTGVADLEEVTVTFTTDGTITPITNPYNAAAVPVISKITPSGKAAGQAVNIFGANFTGVTGAGGVKFGGTNATDYTVVSDSQITAVLPAGSAGTTTVLVTNGAGGSTATNNYVRA